MSEVTEKWSSLEETAEYLGVTKDTIRSATAVSLVQMKKKQRAY